MRNAYLSDREAQAVVFLFDKGIRNDDLAAAFQVTPAAISHIVAGRNHSEVDRKRASRRAPLNPAYRRDAYRFYDNAEPRAGR